MSMRNTRLAEATPFDPPGHHGVGPVRLQGPRPDGSFHATVIRFALTGLFDSRSAGQRERVLLPHSDLVLRNSIMNDGCRSVATAAATPTRSA